VLQKLKLKNGIILPKDMVPNLTWEYGAVQVDEFFIATGTIIT